MGPISVSLIFAFTFLKACIGDTIKVKCKSSRSFQSDEEILDDIIMLQRILIVCCVIAVHGNRSYNGYLGDEDIQNSYNHSKSLIDGRQKKLEGNDIVVGQRYNNRLITDRNNEDNNYSTTNFENGFTGHNKVSYTTTSETPKYISLNAQSGYQIGNEDFVPGNNNNPVEVTKPRGIFYPSNMIYRPGVPTPVNNPGYFNLPAHMFRPSTFNSDKVNNKYGESKYYPTSNANVPGMSYLNKDNIEYAPSVNNYNKVNPKFILVKENRPVSFMDRLRSTVSVSPPATINGNNMKNIFGRPNFVPGGLFGYPTNERLIYA